MDGRNRAFVHVLAFVCLAVGLLACGRGERLAAEAACRIEPGELIITELMAKPADASPPWLEIHNTSSRTLQLSRLVITMGSASGARSVSLSQAGDLPPGGYRVLGERAEGVVELAYEGRGAKLSGEQGWVALSCQGVEIDRAAYERIDAGKSLSLGRAMPGREVQPAWCQAEATPAKANRACGITICEQADGRLRPVRHADKNQWVISELMADPMGEDAGREWLELHWRGEGAVDLNGIELSDDKGRRWTLPGAICRPLSAGERVVLAIGEGEDNPAMASYRLTGPALANNLTSLTLRQAGRVVDRAEFGQAIPAGAALGLDPDWAEGEGPRRYCPARSRYDEASGARGTPGRRNDVCGLACRDETGQWRRQRLPAAGELLINEVMADPAGADAGAEWVELWVSGQRQLDLNGLTLVAERRDNGKQRSWRLESEACLAVVPGDYVLLGAVVADADGQGHGIPLPGLNLYNSALDLSLRLDGELIDSARLDAPATGISQSLDPALAHDPAANDVASAFCAGRSQFAAGAGTPGVANDPCGDFCREDGQWRPWQSPGVGALRITEFYPNPKGADDNRDWIELYVDAPYAVDLNGLRLTQFLSEDRQRQWRLEAAECLRVQPGEYRIIAGERAAGSDGVPVFHVQPGLDFYSSRAGELRLEHGAILVEQVHPPKAASGVAVVREGLSEVWCRASSASGGFTGLGSPGEANDGC